jgi:hypothetical protein
VVVNPSSMPKRRGDRIKTDRRDPGGRRPIADGSPNGVPWPRALGLLEWPQGVTGRDHEGRQSARAAVTRRSGVGLPRDSAPWTSGARPTRSVTKDGVRHRVEGAVALDRAVSTVGRARESETQGGDRDRAGAGRLHLGDRAGGAGTARITGVDPVRPVGGIVIGWRTLEAVMDVSTIDTSGPRARQLRDEPQSGRYPTRESQQRQPSLERGAADRVDLKIELRKRVQGRDASRLV